LAGEEISLSNLPLAIIKVNDGLKVEGGC